MSSNANPYAAPSAHPVAEASADTGDWKVSPPYLYFRDGARLPDVDLFPHTSGLPPIPHSSTFVAPSHSFTLLSLLIGIAAGFFAAVFLLDTELPGLARLKPYFPVAVLVLIVGTRLFFRPRKFRLSWFASPTPHLNLLRRLALVSFYFGLAVLIFQPAILRTFPNLRPSHTLLIAVALFFASPLFRILMRQKIRIVRRENDWLIASGIPADALHQLSARQNAADASPSDALIHDLYVYRLPLGVLIENEWWNPARVLIVLILKLARSRHLVTPRYSSHSIQRIPLSPLPANLEAKVRPILLDPGFSSWTPLCATHLGHPQGTLLTDSLTLLSPDRTTLLTLALVNGANPNAHYELFETTFRTPLSDRTFLVTSNRPFHFPNLPEHHTAFHKGPPSAVAAFHRQRLARSPSPALPFPAETDFFDLLLRECLRRDQLWIEKGYMSSARESFPPRPKKIATPPSGNS